MDVRSASMLFYISDEHITGPEDYYLKFTVGQYNAALAKFHVRIGIKAYELLQDAATKKTANVRRDRGNEN